VISVLVTPAATRADLIALWNFNDASAGQTGGAFEFSVDRTAAGVTASMSSTFVPANITNFTGTTINAQGGDSAGQALALQGGAGNINNGAHLTFAATTTGFENIIISFATQRTATGFNSNQFQYSTDGVTFVNFGSPYVPPASFALQTFDLSAITGLDHNPLAAFRILFNGATNAAGNNRIDNLIIAGDLAAVPAPAGNVVFGLGMLGLVTVTPRFRKIGRR
jgi:hypothetical protein